MTIDAPFTTGVLQSLVRINSVNPSLSPSGAGEAEIARYTATMLAGLGLDVQTHEPLPGRVSVTGRLRGIGGGAGAHAKEEWVDVGSVVQFAEVLAAAAARYCG